MIDGHAWGEHKTPVAPVAPVVGPGKQNSGVSSPSLRHESLTPRRGASP